MSLLCPKCRETYRIVGSCPECEGRDPECARCYGTGREIACGCSSAAAPEARRTNGKHQEEERPAAETKKKYGRPEEPTLESLARSARERRGAPKRRPHFEHDFRDGRCVICGKLEMLARPHGWSCM